MTKPSHSDKASSPFQKKARAAFSLVELMVAFAILGISTAGVLSGILQTRKMTEGSIYHNTANTIANGFLQQLMDMQYAKLSTNPVDTLTDVEASGLQAGAEDALTVSPTVSNVEAGNVTTDVTNTRLIDIHNTPDNTTDDMPLKIVLYIEDVADSSNGVGNGKSIILRYTYNLSAGAGAKEATQTIYAIRSQVPNF